MLRMNEGTVDTMLELLERMSDGGYGSRKTGATLYRLRSTPPEVYLKEHFDSGKGASNALWDEGKNVAPELFDQALRAGYLINKPEWGRVSEWEFVITGLGKRVYQKNEQIVEIALENLYLGKDMRACDICIYVPWASEEEVGAVLDDLVRRGYAESGELGGQKFYRFVEHCAAAVRAIAA